MVEPDEAGTLFKQENSNQRQNDDRDHRVATKEGLNDAVGVLTQKERTPLAESGFVGRCI